ncbi:hypothetical protein [Bradyrhizobium valentinum]|uniref:Uncharacterized protein n=1 Tax=Bradyrhizobium valentinum TaxID=1518501 RepID=A0A0R3LUB3_9BRAD|nr:hypothetical protein [Bradyrhizobium valentinum]KRR11545.1 hypothetical protein CP49_18085 [Bradyrhizobium valentinum]
MTKSTAALKSASPFEPQAASRTPFGYRIYTWCAMTEMSRATLYRQIAAGKLKVIKPNGIPMIPHAEAVRLGYVTE